jgi:hypothetical protein
VHNINVDIPTVVGTIEACFPRVHSLRRELLALPDFPRDVIEKLPEWALALGNADARHAAATAPPALLGTYVEEGSKLRGALISQAESFARFGLLDPAQVSSLNSGQSHRSIGRDLQTAAHVYRRNWSRLEGKSPVTRGQLARAMFLGEQIVALVAFKDQVPSETGTPAETRRRLFTLVESAWDEIRSGVAYIRRHQGDVDEIAPSIHARPNSGRKPESPNSPPETSTGASGMIAPSSHSTDAALNAIESAPVLPKNNPFSDK